MFGPVYALELQQASRRARKRHWRWAYSGLLLLAVLVIPYAAIRDLVLKESGALATVSEVVLSLMVGVQMAAIVLLAPAFAAGSIADEKRRGTLDFLLITPLSSAEIVVGKWLAQATQVLHLLSPAYFMLPLLAGAIGEPPSPLFITIALQVLLLYAVIALSLCASTLTRSTAKAIVGVYLFLAGMLTLEWFFDLPSKVGPSLWAMPLRSDSKPTESIQALGSLALLTCASLALAAWRLRPAHEGQQGAAAKALGRWWDRPPISDAPMRWKERFIGDWLSIPIWRMLPRWLKCVLFAAVTAVIALAVPTLQTFVIMAAAQFLLTGMIVAVRAAASITGERENQTWESLLTTHMDMYQIVRGKLWGQIDAIRPYLLAYLTPALVGALLVDWFAAFCIAYAWIASWVFLYYLGAIGIHCSARAPSTWRSIAATLLGGVTSLFPTAPILMILILVVGGLFFSCGFAFAVVKPGGAAVYVGGAIVAVAALAGGTAMIFAETESRLMQAEKELKHQRDERIFGGPLLSRLPGRR